MTRWLLTRLGGGLLTLLVAAVVVYGALRLVPGDPAAVLAAGRRLDPEQLAALRERTGVDQPFVPGFLGWLGGVLHGDLGRSSVYQDEVTSLLAGRLPTTLGLIALSALLTTVLGFGLGLLGAVRGGRTGRAVSVLTSAAVATPPFVAAIVLLSVFAVQLGWFPSTGAGSGFLDRVWHLTLPSVAMALATFGVLARLTQTSLTEQLRREHVAVARSRGIPPSAVVRRHVVRNGLGPVVTLLGLLVATLFVGTAVIETAFGLNGIGAFLVSSVAQRDFPVVQAICLIAVAVFVVLSTVVDLLIPLIDPSLRKERALS